MAHSTAAWGSQCWASAGRPKGSARKIPLIQSTQNIGIILENQGKVQGVLLLPKSYVRFIHITKGDPTKTNRVFKFESPPTMNNTGLLTSHPRDGHVGEMGYWTVCSLQLGSFARIVTKMLRSSLLTWKTEVSMDFAIPLCRCFHATEATLSWRRGENQQHHPPVYPQAAAPASGGMSLNAHLFKPMGGHIIPEAGGVDEPLWWCL